MVTLKQLETQIKAKRAKLTKAQDFEKLQLKKRELTQELKQLNVSPGKRRSIEIAKRTGRGFRRLAIIGGKALIKQGRLIKEQQERDAALQRRSNKAISKGIKRAGKKVSKKIKRTNRKVSRGLRRSRR